MSVTRHESYFVNRDLLWCNIEYFDDAICDFRPKIIYR